MPYILNTQKDIQDMLKAVGVSSIEQLYSQIPDQVRLKKPLNLESGYSELDVKRRLTQLASKNIPSDNLNSFLGAGCYDHYIPAALAAIIAQPQFLTAYTPYQAECSQGILQAIYEYQSFMCILTGMDISNASLLDGASGFSEAVLMSLRITKKKKIILAGGLNPEYKQTLKTYLSGFNFVIEEIPLDDQGVVNKQKLKLALSKDVACCAFSSPNFFGLIEDISSIVDMAKAKGALTVMITNPLSLAIIREPAEFGVDIVCGDGQPFGGSLNLGGSSFGFLTTKEQYLRQVPGRIVGKTTDKEGKVAYCLTLQTREQHIRREKATSNICSNQSLNAIAASVYLSLLGSEGLKNVATISFNNVQYLYQRLKEVRGILVPYPSQVFNEFVWEVDDAPRIIKLLYEKNIIAGYNLGKISDKYENKVLSCCTEKKTKEDIDNFVNSLAEVLHG